MGDAEASGEARATHPASPIPHPAAPPARSSEALSHSESPRALMNKLPVILAITGASGAPYGVRLLEMLAVHHVPTWLLVSSHGWRLLTEESRADLAPGLEPRLATPHRGVRHHR